MVVAGVLAGLATSAVAVDDGFLLVNGTFHPIQVPGSNGNTRPFGINNAGQIVGSFSDSRGRSILVVGCSK